MAERFATKELSKRTWPDYVRFFTQGNGWDHCGCTVAQGFRPPKEARSWADQRDWNLALKRRLVDDGRAHGVLVYAGAEPVGWCQFGPAGELPIVEPGRRRSLFSAGEERLWKITCFCTRPDHSREGVAGVALHAALRGIARRGGGRVEGYPVALAKGDPRSDPRLAAVIDWERTLTRLIREHGRSSQAVEEHLGRREPVMEVVDGVGEVVATYDGRFSCGTVAMFQREGFEAVSVLAPNTRARTFPHRHPTRVVMTRDVPPAR